MRLRALHLASVFLLLASMSSADAASLRENKGTLGAHYIAVLLAQQEAAARTTDVLSFSPRSALSLDRPLKTAAASYTLRPTLLPVDQAAHTHAVTGSSL